MNLIVPTSELEAVNIMLGTIGETPVNTLDGVVSVDAAMARDGLRTFSRQTQSRGYWFNTDDTYTFTLNADGKVPVPQNLLAVRPIRGGPQLVPRAGFLYDRAAQTDTFTTAPQAEAVWGFDFDTLPESARRFITVSAARTFQAQVLGSDALDVFTKNDEQEALTILLAEHNDFVVAQGYNYHANTGEIWDR